MQTGTVFVNSINQAERIPLISDACTHCSAEKKFYGNHWQYTLHYSSDAYSSSSRTWALHIFHLRNLSSSSFGPVVRLMEELCNAMSNRDMWRLPIASIAHYQPPRQIKSREIGWTCKAVFMACGLHPSLHCSIMLQSVCWKTAHTAVLFYRPCCYPQSLISSPFQSERMLVV